MCASTNGSVPRSSRSRASVGSARTRASCTVRPAMLAPRRPRQEILAPRGCHRRRRRMPRHQPPSLNRHRRHHCRHAPPTLTPPIRPSLPGLFEPPRLSPSQLRLAGLAFSAVNFAACLPLAPRVFCFLAYLLYFVYFPQLFAEVIARDRGDTSPRSDPLATRATPSR